MEKETAFSESFVGNLSNNCTSFWVFWTSTCHISHGASWYIVLIESDSSLSQHPSGHLATVAPGIVTHSNPAAVGPGPRLCPRMHRTHKTRAGGRYSIQYIWQLRKIQLHTGTQTSPYCLPRSSQKSRKLHKMWHDMKLKIRVKAGLMKRRRGRTHHSELLCCVGFPQSDVHFVRSAQDVFVVCWPLYADDMLHAFGVVHLPEKN